MSDRQYRVGEVVLLQYQGWLKAFRVVKTEIENDIVEYTLSMVELEGDPRYQWQKPTRG